VVDVVEKEEGVVNDDDEVATLRLVGAGTEIGFSIIFDCV